MSTGSEPATLALDIDLLAESRFARCRRRKQERKAFTCCQQCNAPLVSKWGTLLGTNDAAKAICTTCKRVPKGCAHPKLRSFTFSDGKTIKLCPDCTTFDGARYSALNKGKKKSIGITKSATSRAKQITKDRPSCYQGMAHIVGCDKSILMYPWVVDVTVVPNYYYPMRCPRTRIGIGALPKVYLQPIKASVVDYEYRVVPLPCTKVKAEDPTYTELKAAWRQRKFWEVEDKYNQEMVSHQFKFVWSHRPRRTFWHPRKRKVAKRKFFTEQDLKELQHIIGNTYEHIRTTNGKLAKAVC